MGAAWGCEGRDEGVSRAHIVRLHHTAVVVLVAVVPPDAIDEALAHADLPVLPLAVVRVLGLLRVTAEAIVVSDRWVHHRVLAAGAEAVNQVLELQLVLHVVPRYAARLLVVVLTELEVPRLRRGEGREWDSWTCCGGCSRLPCG